ncbi:FAD:protein FMN transferase, partial [Paracoccus sphaerophysae]|uniref:FAD:protein FMN transferase n=1 Tax=Paracoccus sphaerophysae TaxID=690417 RepID=UPI0023592F46
MTLSGPAMGSRWTARLAAPAPGLAATLAAAVERIEAQASLWRAESDLCRLNAAPVSEWVALPAELFDLLTLSLELGRETGGLFDIAMGGLS